MSTSKCPYCNVRDCNSDDHIFSEFLGGRTTIRTCKPCNDTFGHSIEGPLSRHLAPIVITLRKAGLRAPRRVIWEKAFIHEGIEHDIDSDLTAWASKPRIVKDETGAVTGAYFIDEKSKKKFAASGRRQGKQMSVTDLPPEVIPAPNTKFQISVGPELHRLATKIAVATVRYVRGDLSVLDDGGRAFLLGDSRADRCSWDLQVRGQFEALRSSLAHCAYVEGDPASRCCYGVVQFYGLLQFFVLLNDGNYSADDFAIRGVLNPISNYTESFELVAPLRLPTVDNSLHSSIHVWAAKFSEEMKATLGPDKGAISIIPPRQKWRMSSGTAERADWIFGGTKREEE